jgi:hypothetical protein
MYDFKPIDNPSAKCENLNQDMYPKTQDEIEKMAYVSYTSVVVTTLFFFFLINTKMNYHSGTTICRKTNIWYKFHNMYLIYRVNIYAAEYI